MKTKVATCTTTIVVLDLILAHNNVYQWINWTICQQWVKLTLWGWSYVENYVSENPDELFHFAIYASNALHLLLVILLYTMKCNYYKSPRRHTKVTRWQTVKYVLDVDVVHLNKDKDVVKDDWLTLEIKHFRLTSREPSKGIYLTMQNLESPCPAHTAALNV